MRFGPHIVCLAIVCSVALQQSAADDSKDKMIVETILRLQDFDLSGSEKAQAAVARYLESNRGGDRYFDLIRRFELKEEVPGVLELALENPDSPEGAEAAMLLVELGADDALSNALNGTDKEIAAKAAKAIAQKSPLAGAFLVPLGRMGS